MTLHWWMHWFWVTTLLLILFGSGEIWAAPQMEELHQISTDAVPDPQRPSERQGRAMYFTKTIFTPTTPKIPPAVINTTQKVEEEPIQDQKEPELNVNKTDTSNVTTEIVHPSLHWTPVNATEVTNTSTPEAAKNQTNLNSTSANTNMTDTHNTTVPPSRKRNLTRHPEVKEIDSNIEGVAESRIVTEKPLSLETTFLQTRIPPNIESSRRIIDQPSGGGMDTGEIAGISFAALVLAALAGSTAFVLYRRRYLNKPQTLNDKCSNPDSSGYLDDSTIRDNSEEMYSLDNDSFLNSLEAMTIQNYWTDTVKHTKL